MTTIAPPSNSFLTTTVHQVRERIASNVKDVSPAALNAFSVELTRAIRDAERRGAKWMRQAAHLAVLETDRVPASNTWYDNGHQMLMNAAKSVGDLSDDRICTDAEEYR